MSPAAVVSSTTAAARAALVDALGALEAAVRSLECADGETVMASDEVLSLLSQMIAARSHLAEVDRPGQAGVPRPRT